MLDIVIKSFGKTKKSNLHYSSKQQQTNKNKNGLKWKRSCRCSRLRLQKLHFYFSIQLHVCGRLKYVMACICSWLFVALACTLVLDLGLWRISAQETRGPCGPLMGTAALTVEECFRAHTVSTFLSDAPHASHTHEKLQTFTAPAGPGEEISRRRERSTNRKTWWRVSFSGRALKSLRAWRECK